MYQSVSLLVTDKVTVIANAVMEILGYVIYYIRVISTDLAWGVTPA